MLIKKQKRSITLIFVRIFKNLEQQQIAPD